MASIPYITDTYLDGKSHKETAFSLANAADFYRLFRPGGTVPKDVVKTANSVEATGKMFKLKGIQFGNWTTTEDRHDYLALTYLCLTDMNKVLKFKNNNLGLDGKLAFSFGSRGSGGALGHYESNNQVINITRYWRTDKINRIRESFGKPPLLFIPKSERFEKTGGAGSFAHEYGHFLDYTFGRYIAVSKDSNWLTGPYRTTSITIEEQNHPLRKLTKEVMDAILLDSKGNRSAYSKRIQKEGEYWNRRLEVFARFFEQYISFKLSKLKITNKFLAKPVYRSSVYLNNKEFAKVVPKMDKLVAEMRKYT